MRLRLALFAAAILAAPLAALPPKATPTVANGLVISDHSGYLLSINIVTGATAGYVMLFDAATIPADGTVSPIMCMPVAATTGLQLNFRSEPVTVGAGAAVVFSSGASCFALTKSATAYIAGEVR